MFTTLLLLLTLVLLTALAGIALAAVLRGDGYGHPTPGHQPPRSHVADLFDPRHTV